MSGDIIIKKNRIKNGLTQEKLAELIDITPRQLQRIEKDEMKTKLTTLRKIIKVLNIPDNEIIAFFKEK